MSFSRPFDASQFFARLWDIITTSVKLEVF